jgi:hypothetical protein
MIAPPVWPVVNSFHRHVGSTGVNFKDSHFQKRAGHENFNASERMEHDQVGVTCDDVICLPTDGKLQELIIHWIAAGSDLHMDVNPLSLARQGGEKVPNVLLIYIPAESLSAKDVVKFSEDSKRQQDFPFLNRQIQGHPGLRIVQERRAYKYAGIENAPQLFASKQ